MKPFASGLVGLTACVVLAGPASAQIRPNRPNVLPVPPVVKDKLAVGAPAPDFRLPLANGKGEIQLSSFRGKKPVVIAFGSYTSRLLRVDAAALERVANAYQAKAEFLIVYIREAHPGLAVAVVRNGRRVQEPFHEAASFAERAEHARLFADTLKVAIPVLVDRQDNATESAYVGFPNRLFIVGADGKVAYLGPYGPWGAKPAEVEGWLKKDLPAPKPPAK